MLSLSFTKNMMYKKMHGKFQTDVIMDIYVSQVFDNNICRIIAKYLSWCI